MKVVKRKIARRYNFMLCATAMVTFAAILEIFDFVLQVNAKQVILADSNLELTYETSHKDVEGFLKSNNIEIGPNDLVNVDLDEEISERMVIEIRRAMPVTLVVSGIAEEIETAHLTVGDLLKEKGIALSPRDDINVDLDTPLKSEMIIDIKKHSSDVEVREEIIDYPVVYENTSSLNKGVEQLKQNGVEGLKEVTYNVHKQNRTEVGKDIVETKIIKEAVPKIILRGTREVITASNGKNYEVKEVLTMNSTAYTNSLIDTGKEPGHPLYGITRSGLKTKVGIVAVDPNVIPLMTKLYVEGYGEAIAADTGSAIKGHKIDLFMDTREEALRYGRKDIKVYVLE